MLLQSILKLIALLIMLHSSIPNVFLSLLRYRDGSVSTQVPGDSDSGTIGVLSMIDILMKDSNSGGDTQQQLHQQQWSLLWWGGIML